MRPRPTHLERTSRAPAPAGRAGGLALLLLAGLLAAASGAPGATEAPMQTRPCALAGTWYPEDPQELARSVDAHIAHGRALEEVARGRPLALIAPHAGHRWSGDAAGSVYRLLAGEPGRDIERVLLLGPSHYQAYRGVTVTVAGAYATPLGAVPVDTAAARALLAEAHFRSLPAAERQEHCLEIQLPFLQRALAHPFRIVPLLVSHASPAEWREIAAALARQLDERTLVVISSDFTHFGARFGYTPFDDEEDLNLRRLDRGALEPILALDAEGFAAYRDETDISVCGANPIGILLELLRRPDAQARWGGRPPEGRVLDYYRSADLLGDFEGSVSYAAVAFFRAGDLLEGEVWPRLLAGIAPYGRDGGRESRPAGSGGPGAKADAPAVEDTAGILSATEQRYLLELARRTIEEATAGRTAARPSEFPPGVSAARMKTPLGVFVTLEKRHALRGCIGHIIAQEPLVEAVVSNAISAAFRDPRFPPVSAAEVPDLLIEISVLTPLRRISGPEEIEVGRHGVVLERGGHRAVFLPQVAPEQGWDRETMLDHLAMKAGLPRDAWRRDATFEVFEAFVFAEE